MFGEIGGGGLWEIVGEFEGEVGLKMVCYCILDMGGGLVGVIIWVLEWWIRFFFFLMENNVFSSVDFYYVKGNNFICFFVLGYFICFFL